MAKAIMVSARVSTISTVEAALTSGVTEKRTMEYIFIGNVVEPGPEVKKVMTKSSSDKVNASSAPAIMPGFKYGNVTFQKVCHWFAPRSYDASSSERSKPAMRALITTATKGMENATKSFQNKKSKKLARLMCSSKAKQFQKYHFHSCSDLDRRSL